MGAAGDVDALCAAADADPQAVRALADLLSEDGRGDVVILWGERVGAAALPALLNVAGRLGLADREGAGLLEVPASANARGLREAGVLPNAGAGLRRGAGRGPLRARDRAGGRRRRAGRALPAAHRPRPRPRPTRRCGAARSARASTVVAHASFLTDELREHATVVFPAESYAEKEGTVTHPDGRLQRLRPGIGHPGAVRAEWSVLAELERRVSDSGSLRPRQDTTSPLTGPMASAQLFEAVPFYAGLTLEEIGGRGVRWQEREAADGRARRARDVRDRRPGRGADPQRRPAPRHLPLDLGVARGRGLAGAEVPRAPRHAGGQSGRRRAARRRARRPRDRVGADDRTVSATVALRGNAPAGTVFLDAGLPEGGASELTDGAPQTVTVERAATRVEVPA